MLAIVFGVTLLALADATKPFYRPPPDLSAILGQQGANLALASAANHHNAKKMRHFSFKQLAQQQNGNLYYGLATRRNMAPFVGPVSQFGTGQPRPPWLANGLTSPTLNPSLTGGLSWNPTPFGTNPHLTGLSGIRGPSFARGPAMLGPHFGAAPLGQFQPLGLFGQMRSLARPVLPYSPFGGAVGYATHGSRPMGLGTTPFIRHGSGVSPFAFQGPGTLRAGVPLSPTVLFGVGPGSMQGSILGPGRQLRPYGQFLQHAQPFGPGIRMAGFPGQLTAMGHSPYTLATAGYSPGTRTAYGAHPMIGQGMGQYTSGSSIQPGLRQHGPNNFGSAQLMGPAQHGPYSANPGAFASQMIPGQFGSSPGSLATPAQMEGNHYGQFSHSPGRPGSQMGSSHYGTSQFSPASAGPVRLAQSPHLGQGPYGQGSMTSGGIGTLGGPNRVGTGSSGTGSYVRSSQLGPGPYGQGGSMNSDEINTLAGPNLLGPGTSGTGSYTKSSPPGPGHYSQDPISAVGIGAPGGPNLFGPGFSPDGPGPYGERGSMSSGGMGTLGGPNLLGPGASGPGSYAKSSPSVPGHYSQDPMSAVGIGASGGPNLLGPGSSSRGPGPYGQGGSMSSGGMGTLGGSNLLGPGASVPSSYDQSSNLGSDPFGKDQMSPVGTGILGGPKHLGPGSSGTGSYTKSSPPGPGHYSQDPISAVGIGAPGGPNLLGPGFSPDGLGPYGERGSMSSGGMGTLGGPNLLGPGALGPVSYAKSSPSGPGHLSPDSMSAVGIDAPGGPNLLGPGSSGPGSYAQSPHLGPGPYDQDPIGLKGLGTLGGPNKLGPASTDQGSLPFASQPGTDSFGPNYMNSGGMGAKSGLNQLGPGSADHGVFGSSPLSGHDPLDPNYMNSGGISTQNGPSPGSIALASQLGKNPSQYSLNNAPFGKNSRSSKLRKDPINKDTIGINKKNGLGPSESNAIGTTSIITDQTTKLVANGANQYENVRSDVVPAGGSKMSEPIEGVYSPGQVGYPGKEKGSKVPIVESSKSSTTGTGKPGSTYSGGELEARNADLSAYPRTAPAPGSFGQYQGVSLLNQNGLRILNSELLNGDRAMANQLNGGVYNGGAFNGISNAQLNVMNNARNFNHVGREAGEPLIVRSGNGPLGTSFVPGSSFSSNDQQGLSRRGNNQNSFMQPTQNMGPLGNPSAPNNYANNINGGRVTGSSRQSTQTFNIGPFLDSGNSQNNRGTNYNNNGPNSNAWMTGSHLNSAGGPTGQSGYNSMGMFTYPTGFNSYAGSLSSSPGGFNRFRGPTGANNNNGYRNNNNGFSERFNDGRNRFNNNNYNNNNNNNRNNNNGYTSFNPYNAGAYNMNDFNRNNNNRRNS